jgi:5S rRNA maturation endonuclease (ribonuclease M5)
MRKRREGSQKDLRDRVQEANPLAKVVEEYGVELPSAAGHVLVQCCLPGHDDTRPSLSLNLDKGLWKCFGCGRKGTVFDFVMCMEGVDFAEALHRLAIRAGIPFDDEGGSQSKPDRRLEDLLETVYDYKARNGHLLFQVLRLKEKRFIQRQPKQSGGWLYTLGGVKYVPYRLPELYADPDATVFIVEGEKDADRLTSLGLVASTNPSGVGKWEDEYSFHFKGRTVVILPDNDEPGRKHAESVALSLAGKARSIKIVRLSDLPEKGDVSDWLDAGHSVEELQKLVAETAEYQPPQTSVGVTDLADEDEGSQADRMVNMALARQVELFHDLTGDPFAWVEIDGHHEILHCGGKAFRNWLAALLWRAEGKAPCSGSVQAARNVLEAMARFNGKRHELCNRVALHEGSIWYDLSDAPWRAVRITPSGWQIVDDPPILFRRHKHQAPQVEPLRGGDVHRFLEFVNVRSEADRMLLLVYLVSCFVPEIPHPIPDLHGGHGAAKSTLFRFLRRICDPSCIELLGFPRDIKELVQQLSHHWCAYYDNISRLPEWISDILCRAVTGDGFSKRELYSDDDDVIYRFRRCVGLNGVNVVSRTPDLLDRAITIRLEPILPDARRPESELDAAFDEVRPVILGGVFDALAEAIRLRPSMRLAGLPRMADFALWGCAIAQALGYEQDQFLAAYEQNAQARNEEILQSNPVAAAVVALLDEQQDDEWRGTSTELLGQLKRVADTQKIDTESPIWPKAANALTRRLNEVQSNLQAEGVQVRVERGGKSRIVVLSKGTDNTVTTVITVTEAENTPETASQAALSYDGFWAGVEKPSQVSSHPEAPSGAACDGNDDNDDICRNFDSGDEPNPFHLPDDG